MTDEIWLKLPFEFGIIISQVAKEMNVELTQEIVLRAEEILLDQYKTKTAQEFANQMNGCALAVFEPKEPSQDVVESSGPLET